jgi:hypothetical protein
LLQFTQQFPLLELEFGEIPLGFFEPLVFLGEFSIEQGDVVFALAEHVGGARHVYEGRVADLRAVGTNGDEEVRVVGERIAGIHPRFDRVARLVRLEGNALHVILEE